MIRNPSPGTPCPRCAGYGFHQGAAGYAVPCALCGGGGRVNGLGPSVSAATIRAERAGDPPVERDRKEPTP